MKIYCKICQKEFKVSNWNKNKKFCSHKCYWVWLRGKKNPEHSAKMKKLFADGIITPHTFWKGKKNPEHSVRMKGHIPWNKGKKGTMPEPWCKGKKGIHLSPKTEFKKGNTTGTEALKRWRKNGGVPHNKGKTFLALGKHYNWQGGKSFEPYTTEFNKHLKEFVRNRDGFICILCGKTEEEEKKEYNQRLSIDHINGDKKNCSVENLRTLCCKCNSKEMQNLRKSQLSKCECASNKMTVMANQ